MEALRQVSTPGFTYGDWLKKARKNAHMSQDQLANTIGVTQGDISRWERDKYRPTVYEARRFADATGAEYLYDLRNLPEESDSGRPDAER